jgi:hypothetical protein
MAGDRLMIVSLGDVVKRTGKEERLQVRGYYKVINEPPIKDEMLREIVEELDDEDRVNGTYVEKIRIAPCAQSEATIIGTGQSFYPVSIIEFVEKCPLHEDPLKQLIQSFERKLSLYAKGELYDCTYKLRKKRFKDVC